MTDDFMVNVNLNCTQEKLEEEVLETIATLKSYSTTLLSNPQFRTMRIQNQI